MSKAIVRRLNDYMRIMGYEYAVVAARNDGRPDPAIPSDFSQWERGEAIEAVNALVLEPDTGLWTMYDPKPWD